MSARMSTHSPIRVGISGFGRSGCGIHATTLTLLPELYSVKAVFDPLPGRSTDSPQPGIAAHASFEDLIADPDLELIVVSSPNKWHARQARAALAAGKHVLCEKPFGFTTADVDAMIAAAQSAGRILQPFQQRRYEPDFIKVREICQSGLLGKIKHVRIAWHGFGRRWDWQTLRSFGGGQLYNNGPHLIDHALELFGPADPEIWCDFKNSLSSGDAEDEFKILLRADNAPTIQLELLATAAYGDERWRIGGTAGGLRGNADRLDWKSVDWSAMPPRPADDRPTPDRGYNGEKLTWREDSWTPAVQADAGAGSAPAQQPVRDLYTDLWKTIREGAPQVITPHDVRRRIAVMEACYRQRGIPFPEGTLQ
jgi:scyllo-inositol 2-dehydrogenase (NADP+)